MKQSWNRSLLLGIAVLVAADWLTKLWVISRLRVGESLVVLDGWLYLIHRKNPGVAFSMFADMSEAWRVPVLSLVSLLGVVLFAHMMRTTRDRVVQLSAALVVAGAVGNLGDRLLAGHVTDFVLLSFFPFVFNLADAAITVGGVALTARLLLVGEETNESEPVPAA